MAKEGQRCDGTENVGSCGTKLWIFRAVRCSHAAIDASDNGTEDSDIGGDRA